MTRDAAVNTTVRVQGGSNNFQADQDLARALIAVEPNVRAIARANRAFLGRAVRFLAGSGIRQFAGSSTSASRWACC